MGDLPLTIAFMFFAAYTYTSGLRAPAMIAFIKDAMIYIVTIATVIAVVVRFGGLAPIFAAAQAHFDAAATAIPKPAAAGSTDLGSKGYWAYATLALGSAFPAYSLLLGLVALLGYAAIAIATGLEEANTAKLASHVVKLGAWPMPPPVPIMQHLRPHHTSDDARDDDAGLRIRRRT